VPQMPFGLNTSPTMQHFARLFTLRMPTVRLCSGIVTLTLTRDVPADLRAVRANLQ